MFRRKKENPTYAPPVPQAQPQPSTSSSSTRRQDPMRQQQRDQTRQLGISQRDIQRERARLEIEERQLMSQIKTLGKQGRVAEARMIAKNLVQLRKAKERTLQASSNITAIGNQAKMAQTDHTLVKAMKGSTDVMSNVNQLSGGDKIQNVVMGYEMQSEKMKLQQEMTDEVLDSVMGGDEINNDTDDVLNSVLDEIGLEVASQVGGATPSIIPTQQSQPQQVQKQHSLNDDELMQRIARLG